MLLNFFTIYIVLSKSLIGSVILSSMTSITFGLLSSIYGAPDLSITEASIGAAVTSVLFIFTIFQSNVNKIYKNIAEKINIKKIVVIVICYFVIVSFFYLSIISLSQNTIFIQNKLHHIKEYYIDNTFADFHFTSIVTAIVAGYRSFDTMLECCVIFFASMIFKFIANDNINEK